MSKKNRGADIWAICSDRPQSFTQAGPGLVIGDEAALPVSIDTAPDLQIQPQTLGGTSNGAGYDTLLGCQFDITSISNADGPPTIEFKSGCRVIQHPEPKSRRKR